MPYPVEDSELNKGFNLERVIVRFVLSDFIRQVT